MTKRNIGIVVLVVINIAFTWMITFYATLSYFIDVGDYGPAEGLERANEIAREIGVFISISALLALVINYFLLLKLIRAKRAGLIASVIVIAGVLICLAFFIYVRQHFIAEQVL